MTSRDRLTREELIDVVERIMNVDGSEEEIDRLIDLFQSNVLDPEATNLIFWPAEHPRNPEGRELTAAEVVDIALQYRPILLPPPPTSDG